MEKNQKILKFLSYFTIIWNSVALAFKIVFLTLLLLLTFVCAKDISLSNEVADAINNAVVENVTPDTYNDTFSENSTQDNKGFKPIPDSKHIEKGIHFSYNGTDFNVNKDFSMSKVSGSDIQNFKCSICRNSYNSYCVDYIYKIPCYIYWCFRTSCQQKAWKIKGTFCFGLCYKCIFCY